MSFDPAFIRVHVANPATWLATAEKLSLVRFSDDVWGLDFQGRRKFNAPNVIVRCHDEHTASALLGLIVDSVNNGAKAKAADYLKEPEDRVSGGLSGRRSG